MKKITFFVTVVACCLLFVCSVKAATECKVNRSDDVSNPNALRYYVEGSVNANASGCSISYNDSTYPDYLADVADSLIRFKSDITIIELTSPITFEPKQTLMVGNYSSKALADETAGDIYKDADGAYDDVGEGNNVLIKAGSFSGLPFKCGSNSIEGVYSFMRRITVEGKYTEKEFFSDTTNDCFKNGGDVHFCKGTIAANADLNSIQDTGDTSGWCDGEVDDGTEEEQTGPIVAEVMPSPNIFEEKDWCRDADRDGFSEKKNSNLNFVMWRIWGYHLCTPHDGLKFDCNDSDETIHPRSSTGESDGIDHNCNGKIDVEDPPTCEPEEETCDGIDNDCDGTTDEDGVCNFCTDYDEDGYPVDSDLCTATEHDCVDNNAEISPAATDVCGDGIDQNCSGSDCADEVCGDGLDNDENGLADCSDTVCVSYSSCNNLPPEVICNDGLDDEGDGAIDCADADCVTLGVCTGEAEVACGDGLDNDADGAFDCDDEDCYNVVFNPETGEACPAGDVDPINNSGSSGCGCYLGAGGAAAGQVGYLSLLFVGLFVVMRVKRRSRLRQGFGGQA